VSTQWLNYVFRGYTVFCVFRHYTVPNMPKIEGMEKFQGRILHSHHFRKNDQFRDENVVLFGGLSSGQDIALVLSEVAKNVYLSHKGRRMASPLPDNFHDVSVST